ncbi:hypothetical protein [Ferrimonas senticii]|uniref:hypothetical protein n=1 Tax=Ferrimonas senticii TaxID=394566 RepID=UPI0003F5ACAA|nr:hypothetical protein [Ferrimonas senticii]
MYSKMELLDGAPLQQDETAMLASLQQTLSEDHRLLMAVRNGPYLTLYRQADYPLANKVLAVMLDRAPEHPVLLKDQANMRLRLFSKEQKRDDIKQLIADVKHHPESREQALQILLTNNLLDSAADLAQQYLDDLNSPRFDYLAMLALYRNKHHDDAVTIALRLLHAERDGDSNLDWIATAAGILVSENHITAAITALNQCAIADSNHLKAKFELARAYFAQDPQTDRVEQLLPKNSNDPRTIDLLARSCLARQQLQQAQRLIAQLPPENQADTLKLELARSYRAIGNLTPALAIFSQVATASPNNAAVQREHVGMLLESGQQQSAIDSYQAWLNRRSDKLPNDFASGVERIFNSPCSHSVPRYRSDWIFNTLSEQGLAPADRQQFVQQLNQISDFDHFLLDWLECRPQQQQQVLPYFNGIDKAAEVLKQTLEQGNGAIVAAAHIGVLFGGPVALQAGGLPATWVASVPDLGDNRFNGALLTTSGNDTSKIGRELIRSLRDNKVVSIAIDGKVASSRVQLPLLGKSIGISDVVPRIAWRKGTASFFPLLYWQDQQVQVQLNPLPLPVDGESLEQYCQRWCQAFMACLTDYFLQHPTSLRGTGGFWTRLRT